MGNVHLVTSLGVKRMHVRHATSVGNGTSVHALHMKRTANPFSVTIQMLLMHLKEAICT